MTLHYLTTATLLMGIMLASYYALLQRDTALHFNRLYLLATLVLPWLAPLVTLPGTASVPPLVQVTLPTFTIGTTESTAATASSVPWLLWLWIGGVALTTGLFLWRWSRIQILQQSTSHVETSIRYVPP